MVIHLGRILNPLGPENLEDLNPGYLAVDSQGRIESYGKWNAQAQKRWSRAQVIDHTPCLIVPGFIDTHLHLPQLDARGLAAPDLMEWLERYIFPIERAFQDPSIARDTARRLFRELAKNGTTTAAIYSSIHYQATDIAFQEAQALGYRAIIGKVLMDAHSPPGLTESTREALEASIELCRKWHGHGGLLFYAFTPRFALSCSEELLKKVGQAAREHGAYIQTHLAENHHEMRLVKELFPHYPYYTDIYHQTGILGPQTIVGHAIHLAEEEFQLLAATGTRVAHCPSSNLFLHSGKMDLPRMDEHGITVALGSDIGAGPSLSMFQVMKDMYYINPVTPVRAFFHATLAGARALGMEDKIGNFKGGKEADFVVLDPRALTDPQEKTTTILSQLIFRGDDRQVVATYVRGKKLHPPPP